MDEFSVFVLLSLVGVVLAFLALGKWYPGSGAEQVDWRPTRSPELEAELEVDDIQQMLEAQNRRRRASGRAEISEEDAQAWVDEDERWRRELLERSRREGQGQGPAPG